MVRDLSQAREAACQLSEAPIGQQLVDGCGLPTRSGTQGGESGGHRNGTYNGAGARGDGTQALHGGGQLHTGGLWGWPWGGICWEARGLAADILQAEAETLKEAAG